MAEEGQVRVVSAAAEIEAEEEEEGGGGGVEEVMEEVFRKVWRREKALRQLRQAHVLGHVSGGEDDCGCARGESTVLDFTQLEGCQERDLVFEVEPAALDASWSAISSRCGVRVQRAFGLRGRPGFLFVPNPFSNAAAQAHWAKKCVVDYVAPDAEYHYTNLAKGMDPREKLPPMHEALRWATLGYHFDWTAREYLEESRSAFPEDLSVMSRALAKAVGLDLHPETAILNYYRRSTNMGGHIDDSECAEAPVVSVSFGCSAVYVLGGESQTDARWPGPVSVILRSGDVCFLSGDSRMAIHGIPCWLPGTCPPDLLEAIADDRVARYLESTRMNLTVRQIFSRLPGGTPKPSCERRRREIEEELPSMPRDAPQSCLAIS